jgi:GH24 family phage-related lysozyme (muramidase)
MTEATAEQYSNPDTHLGRLIAFAYELGTRPEEWTTEQRRKDWRDTWGRLRRWTHYAAPGTMRRRWCWWGVVPGQVGWGAVCGSA